MPTLILLTLLAPVPLNPAALLILQLLAEPGMPSFISRLMFHLVSGVGTACGFYLFSKGTSSLML